MPMDPTTRQVFNALTWPTMDEMSDCDNSPPRRPSPYWLNEKIMQHRRSNGILDGDQKASVARKWKEINQFADLRVMLNLPYFNYTRSSIIMQCLNYRFLSTRKFDFGTFLVEAVSNGLLFESQTFKYTTIITVMHSLEMPLNAVIKDLFDHFKGYKVIAAYGANSREYISVKKYFKKVFSPEGLIRQNHAAVLHELIKDPLKHLNSIALNTDLKRSTVRSVYVDLVRGGVFRIEPLIKSEDARDFVVARVNIESEPDQRPKVLSALMDLDMISGNSLQIKELNGRVLLCLFWAPNVDYVIRATEELNRLVPGARVFSQIKHQGYYFRDASAIVVRRNSNGTKV